MNKPMLRTDMYVDNGRPWSMSTLSKMIGIPRVKVKRMMDEGLPFTMDGDAYLFNSKDAIRWIIDHEVNRVLPQVTGNEEFMPIAEAKQRFEAARALQAELALAKEREQLANIDDLMENFSEALVQVRAKLVSMPGRLSGLLSHQDEGYIADHLEIEISEMLESLSNYNHEYTGNESSSEEPDIKINNTNIPVVPFPTPKIKPG